jgi:hypothetical protein
MFVSAILTTCEYCNGDVVIFDDEAHSNTVKYKHRHVCGQCKLLIDRMTKIEKQWFYL